MNPLIIEQLIGLMVLVWTLQQMVSGVGGMSSRTFADVSPTHRDVSLASCYRTHKRMKKLAYEQRVREVEHATFTPRPQQEEWGLVLTKYLHRVWQ